MNKRREDSGPHILRTLDSALVELMTPGLLLQHYFLASFAYYCRNESPFEDAAFDRLCVRLLECFQTLEHPHKHLVSVDDLVAGTCMLNESEYPIFVNTGFILYCENINNGKMQEALYKILT